MIMSEVLNVMNVCAPSNRAATFMKKDAIGHTKRNIQNTNPRGLHQISLVQYTSQRKKVVFIEQFFPRIFQEIYVFPCHGKIQLRTWENEKA